MEQMCACARASLIGWLRAAWAAIAVEHGVRRSVVGGVSRMPAVAARVTRQGKGRPWLSWLGVAVAVAGGARWSDASKGKGGRV